MKKKGYRNKKNRKNKQIEKLRKRIHNQQRIKSNIMHVNENLTQSTKQKSVKLGKVKSRNTKQQIKAKNSDLYETKRRIKFRKQYTKSFWELIEDYFKKFISNPWKRLMTIITNIGNFFQKLWNGVKSRLSKTDHY